VSFLFAVLLLKMTQRSLLQPYTAAQVVRDVKRFTQSLPKSIGTQGVARSIQARLNHTLRMHSLRVKQFVKFADKITLPFSLEELRLTSKDAGDLAHWCKQLEKNNRAAHCVSAQYLDNNSTPLFYYFGERVKDEVPKEYALQKEKFWENYHLQLENHGEDYLRHAKEQGKTIIKDGIAVSLCLLV
jgi:hypothetical protein